MGSDTENVPDSQSGGGSGHTPEEQAAFDERVETLAGYAELVRQDYVSEQEQATEEAEAIRQRGGGRREQDRRFDKRRPRMMQLLALFVALLAVLIVALVLFNRGGRDVTQGLAAGSAAQIEQIAPPEPAATPEEVLPPEVFTATCADCGAVTQARLDLNKDAEYQFGYNSGETRIAIFTVVEGDEYDVLADSFDAQYEKDKASGDAETPPKELDDVGDDAIVYGGTAVFRSGERCGIIMGNTVQDAGGVVSPTLTAEELERLARIAAPRM